MNRPRLMRLGNDELVAAIERASAAELGVPTSAVRRALLATQGAPIVRSRGDRRLLLRMLASALECLAEDKEGSPSSKKGVTDADEAGRKARTRTAHGNAWLKRGSGRSGEKGSPRRKRKGKRTGKRTGKRKRRSENW